MATELLLHDSVRHAARLHPRRAAVADDASIRTYQELWTRANRLAGALRHGCGLRAGARFGLLATNCAEIAECYVASALAGCACVPLNYRLTAAELTAILTDAEAPLLVAHPGLEDLADACRRAGYPGRVVWIGPDYESLLDASTSEYVPAEPASSADVVLQLYTSGTTGAAKGVMLSHRNLIANSWTNLAEGNVVGGDTYLVTTPLCQIGGVSRLLTSFHASSTVRLLPRFEPDRFLELIDSGRVTTTFLVPTMIRMLLDAAPAGRPIGRPLRRLCYGGSPIPRDLVVEAMARMPCEFQQGYGLTESSPNLTTLRPEDHVVDGPDDAVARLGSVGRESAGVQVRVVDAAGREVGQGQQGEIVARGANIMEGYWRRPEATAEAVRDGWLHTGDVAVVDAEGFIFIVDRMSDMLISGGINVYPRQVELLLEGHPAVAEVAVVGRADPRWGEVPVAFAVLRSGASADAVRGELAALCRERLAGYAAPREYVFVAGLPRNAMGKVLKRELRGRLGEI